MGKQSEAAVASAAVDVGGYTNGNQSEAAAVDTIKRVFSGDVDEPTKDEDVDGNLAPALPTSSAMAVLVHVKPQTGRTHQVYSKP